MALKDLIERIEELTREVSGRHDWILRAGISEGSIRWAGGKPAGGVRAHAGVHVPTTFYTQSGYGIPTSFHISLITDGETLCEEDVREEIARRISTTLKRAEILGHPPVEYREFSASIRHLSIDPIFAGHLDQRYGTEAAEMTQQLVAQMLRREQPGMKRCLPKGSREIAERASVCDMVITGHVVLGEGVTWKCGTLVIDDLVVPDTMMMGMIGSPISEVVRHPALGDRLVTSVRSERRTARPGGTTTIRLDMPAIPVTEWWPDCG